MKISVLAVGRMKSGPERELCARYLERSQGMGRNLSLSGFSVTEFNESRASSEAARKAEEARSFAAALSGGPVIALDERGKSISSEQFANHIGRWRDDGATALDFLIGGADGLDPSLRQKADLVLSFSALTWPHQMVRIMLAEQLYRATTILAGHPYHRNG